MQRFIGFDPTMEPVGDRLANFRIATIALVDELDDWKGLDTWLESERNLGAVLARQVMEVAGRVTRWTSGWPTSTRSSGGLRC